MKRIVCSLVGLTAFSIAILPACGRKAAQPLAPQVDVAAVAKPAYESLLDPCSEFGDTPNEIIRADASTVPCQLKAIDNRADLNTGLLAKTRSFDVAKRLLERGADVNFRTGFDKPVFESQTALNYEAPARSEDQIAILKLLLAKGATFDPEMIYEGTSAEVLNYLLSLGLNPKATRGGTNALDAAVTHFAPEVANILVALGVKPTNPQTPLVLLWAVTGKLAEIKALGPNAPELKKKSDAPSAIQVAYRSDQREVFDYLVSIHSELESVLRLVVSHNDLATLKLLEEKGVDLIKGEPTEPTLLMYAAKANALEVAKYLIQKGASAKEIIEDKEADTALHFAASAEMAKLLIDNGADFRHISRNGLSAIHLAVRGHPEVTEYLLQLGAKPDALELSTRKTPAFYAVLHKDYESLKLLLEHNANPNAINSGKQSLLDVAVSLKRSRKFQDLIRSYVDKTSATPAISR